MGSVRLAYRIYNYPYYSGLLLFCYSIYLLGLCSIRCVLRCVNSLAPSRWENNFKSVIFKLISEIDTLSNSYEIAVG